MEPTLSKVLRTLPLHLMVILSFRQVATPPLEMDYTLVPLLKRQVLKGQAIGALDSLRHCLSTCSESRLRNEIVILLAKQATPGFPQSLPQSLNPTKLSCQERVTVQLLLG
jgi:hypothetical protein